MALASVKLEFITGPAVQAAQKLQRKTQDLSKAMSKFQRLSNRAWEKFAEKAKKTANVVQKNVGKMKKALFSLKGALVSLGVGIFIKEIFGAAASLERMTLKLKTLTGSAAAANKIMSDLKELNKTAPFELPDLVNASTRLSAYGVATEDLVDITERLGKISAGTGSDIGGISLAYGQALAKGKLMGEEMRQFMERGVPVREELEKMLGITGEGFDDAMRKGQISSELLTEAIKNLTGEQGKFKDAFANTADSLDTKLSNMKDAFFNAAAALGKAFEPVFKWFLDTLTTILNFAEKVFGRISRGREGFAADAQARFSAIDSTQEKFGQSGVGTFNSKKAKEFFKSELERFTAMNYQAAGITATAPSVAGAPDATGTGTGTTGYSQDQINKYKGMMGGGDGVDMNKLTSELEKRVKHITEQKELYESMMTTLERKNELLTAADEFEQSKLIAGHEYEDILKDILKIEDKDKQAAAIKEAMQVKTNELKRIEGQITEANAKKAKDAAKEELEQRKKIADMLANETTNAIMGLIDGTKTLGQTLAGIAKQLASTFLNKALGSSGFFGGLLNTKAEGGYMANGIRPFAAGGMATKPTLGLVGEAGEDEYIIPASKMAQSMQRYSAGARGESVIPGTGQSSAGGGADAQTTVNYSGPILNFNSEEYVPKSAIGQIINSAASKGAAAGESRTMSTLRNSRGARSRLGM